MYTGAREMAQLIKQLLHKYEDHQNSSLKKKKLGRQDSMESQFSGGRDGEAPEQAGICKNWIQWEALPQ